LALNVMDQLLEYGEVRRGLLGVRGEDVTPRIAKALDLSTDKGVIVTRVTENSAAEKAGIMQYDVITHLDGKRIRSNSELMNQLGLLSANRKVKLVLIRENRKIELTTSLDQPRYKKFDGEDAHWLLKGVSIGESSNLEEDLSHLKVMQIDNNSFAYESGLRKGDKIIGFDRYRIVNFNQLTRLSARMRRGLPLVIERNDESRLLIIQR
ncbi:MAG: PDZ domain-containing protein, partial [Kangiellaceae bacterium]|nr:PDZ domain-containing protein [Kangiellaceae bacterium]